VSSHGKREWINYKHVLPILDKLNVKLYNSDPTDVFKELEYIDLKEIL
jgi:hypothetical protein